MIRTVALGLTYMALLFAFVAGIEALVGKDCSDWLPNCSSKQLAASLPPTSESPDSRPEAPELR